MPRLAQFVNNKGPSALLVLEEALLDFLRENNLGMFWTILAEKRILGAGFDPEYHPELRLSGACVLNHHGHYSFLKCMFEDSAGVKKDVT